MADDLKWKHAPVIGGGATRSHGSASHGSYAVSPQFKPDGSGKVTHYSATYHPSDGGGDPKKTRSVGAYGTHGSHSEALAAVEHDHVKMSSKHANKSEGATAMSKSKTNFNDLFKSDIVGDDVALDCPHCEGPITKSDLSKAHGGKGATTHLSGPKTSSKPHVAQQNPHGGVTRGGDGHGTISPSRGVPGAKKHDEDHVQSASKSKGKLPHVAKSDKDDDSSSGGDDASSGFPPPKKVKKSIEIRGTEHVMWVNDGSDAALAKSILEGRLGGTPPTQPLDLNNDLTRLLY